MPFKIIYSPLAGKQYQSLEGDKSLEKRFKAVQKALRLLANNPAHPSLHTHEYDALTGPEGAKVFEAYAENKTPAAYRIMWSYHPPKTNTISIILITPHP